MFIISRRQIRLHFIDLHPRSLSFLDLILFGFLFVACLKCLVPCAVFLFPLLLLFSSLPETGRGNFPLVVHQLAITRSIFYAFSFLDERENCIYQERGLVFLWPYASGLHLDENPWSYFVHVFVSLIYKKSRNSQYHHVGPPWRRSFWLKT